MAVKTSTARRYARALLLLAQERNRIQEVKRELERLARYLEGAPALFAQLLSPGLGKQAREKILRSLIAPFGLSPDTGNFLLLLNDKSRLDHLQKIYEAYLVLSDEASGISRARVSSARPLADDSRQRLVAALSKRTGKSILAEFAVDPGLLGGVKVQIGSLLLDGSVKARLRMMEEKLKKI